MIAVVILGLLASIAVYSYSRYLDRAKQQKARTDINTFVNALDLFHGDRGQYPDNQEGLKALVPEFIKSLPNDPWGRPYQYVQPGRTAAFDIVSYGADGREGGVGRIWILRAMIKMWRRRNES
jgi:general secretion pathway protein G